MKCHRTDRASMCLALLLVSIACSTATAADRAREYVNRADSWFAGEEAGRIAANILSYQSPLGGWPKNVDTTAATADNAEEMQATFDNGATTDELRFLARAYNATHEARYRRAFERGMDYILTAQYPTGGWPQFFPPGTKYHRYITFNDDAMVRLLLFLRETYATDGYRFLDASRLAAARRAFDAGIVCILRCQIKIDGKPTAWCAQHDENGFSPRPARTFELASTSGAESVGIVRLLMSLESPSIEVRTAVEGAVRWFDAVKIEGMRQVVQADQNSPTGKNKVLVHDPAAPPLWARFYEIGTNRPIFADRDGAVRYDLAEIGYERRNGYGWYTDRPAQLLDRDYPAWKQKWSK